MKNYTEIDFRIKAKNNELKEILISELFDNDFDSFFETDSGLKAYIEEEKFDKEKLGQIGLLNTYAQDIEYDIRNIADRDWAKSWEQSITPVVVNNDLIVRAPFHPSIPSFKYEIVIEPKMAFGTGHHITTLLMLETIVNTKPRDKKILDAGCGSGILSILASKMQADDIIAVDNNEWAFENAKENVKINNTRNVQVIHGEIDILEENNFDMIFANINRNVLLQDIPNYKLLLNKDGVLIMSGIYNKDFDKIDSLARNNSFKLIEYKERENWVSVSYMLK